MRVKVRAYVTSRVLRLAVVALLAGALVTPEAAVAAQSAAQLRSRINELNAEFKAAGRAFDRAYWELDETQVQIEKTGQNIAANEARLAEVKAKLGARMDAWYRSDDFGVLGFVLSSDNFEDFATRWDIAMRVTDADARVITNTNALLTDLATQKDTLATQEQEQAARVAALKRERDQLQSQLKSKRNEYESLQRQLAAAAAREQASSGRSSGGGSRAALPAGPNGMVFPVAGPNYYSDTWGASRGGGRRRHKGTDVMAATGTPLVAVLDGRVTTRRGGTAGLYHVLTADNGWVFYYMHESSFEVTSGRVRAGQVIGYVGYSGNASASAPHLHFEIHPGGGGAVNPYPYLRGMQ